MQSKVAFGGHYQSSNVDRDYTLAIWSRHKCDSNVLDDFMNGALWYPGMEGFEVVIDEVRVLPSLSYFTGITQYPSCEVIIRFWLRGYATKI